MIFSTRNLQVLRWTTMVAVSFTGAGCLNNAGVVVTTPGSVAPNPSADEATQFRAARQSVALIQSGATQGYPTRWYYAPDPDYSPPQHFLADTGMFIVQTFSLPVTLAIDYPFEKVYYAGDVLPPSYTVMPPLPPDVAVGSSNPAPDPLSAPRPPLLPPLPPIPDEEPPMIYGPVRNPARVATPAEAPQKPPEAPRKSAQSAEKSPTIISPSAPLRIRGESVHVEDSAPPTTQLNK